MEPICALTIAGSDSGGGAGIQADLRTFSAFSVHATCAITAVTAQNTVGVSAVVNLEPGAVVAQIDAVLDDFDVRAVKTGMLAQASTVVAVAELARAGRFATLVVDPVLVSSSGHALLDVGGVEAYRDVLLPHADLVTPNLPEAAVLTGISVHDIKTHDDMLELARRLLDLGPRSVLVKGGHFAASTVTEREAPDLLLGADGLFVFNAPRVTTTNDHGTGCSLAAAITAGLAYGRAMPDAVRDAKSFVLAALTSAASWRLGRGRGPIDHFGWNE